MSGQTRTSGQHPAMLEIDGSAGEGGGQVLRSSLSLSMVTGTPVRIRNVRAKRKRPGLMRQHLTALRAAERICSGFATGAEVGSAEISFTPGPVVTGEHRFAVGTAGSTTLVLQTLLPALLQAAAPSRLVLEGGTHNPLAPPFEFLAHAFLPIIGRMGPTIEARLERHGFAPAGGGRLVVDVQPAPLRPFELLTRGETTGRRATVLLANLPRHIGERELATVAEATGWPPSALEVREVPAAGPGNCLLLELQSEQVTEVFAGFGELGVRAETVAARTVREMRAYLAAGVPVGEHLADQLLLPLALAGGGAFATLPLSRHALTQLELIPRFLPVTFAVERGERTAVVRVARTDGKATGYSATDSTASEVPASATTAPGPRKRRRASTSQ